MRELVATIAKPLALSLFLRQSFPSLPQRQLKNALDRRDVKREGRRLGPGDLVFPGEVALVDEDLQPVARKDQVALPIETAYETLDSCETVSLLRVELITGRTHQIRAHLAAAGFPVCGDDRYGDRAKNRAFHVRTQQLWATELVFHFAGGPLAYLDGRAFSIRPRFTMRGFE